MTLLRVSGMEAARELAKYCSCHPELPVETAVRHLRAGPSVTAKLDYACGLALIDLCGLQAFLREPFSREVVLSVIDIVVAHELPNWRLAASNGHDWCRRGMDPDTAQCLDRAGVWDAVPTDEVIAWWDRLSASARVLNAARRMELGREGERLTLEYEKERLASIALYDKEPQWRSLRDNSLGYDIETWDRDARGEPFQLRVEVKAYSTGRLHFFITRREWEVARRFSPAYRFDVWSLQTGDRNEFSVADVEVVVPLDRPGGEWQNLLVNL